jgi:hypothetical protein
MTTTIQQGEMMGPWLLISEEWLSKLFCFSSKLWLMSDDENFHLLCSGGHEPCFFQMDMQYEFELRN